MFGQKKRLIFGKEISIRLIVPWLLVLLVIPNIVCVLFYYTVKRDFEIIFGKNMLFLAEMVAYRLEGDRLISIFDDTREGRELYHQVEDRIRTVENVEDMYICKYDSQTQSLLDLEKGTFISPGYLKLKDVGPTELAVLHSGHNVVTRTYRADNGLFYKSAYVPLEDKVGQVVAVLGVDGRLEEDLLVKKFRKWMIVSLMLTLPLVFLTFGYLVQPIRETIRNLVTSRRYNQYILQSIRVGVITIDREGRIITFNQSARDILSLGDDVVLGCHYRQVLERQKGLAEFFNQTITRRKEYSQQELELKKDNGSLITISAHSSLIKDSDNKEIGATIFFSDVTAVKELQRQVQLKERLAALGELSAGLAHEIRNPLEGIQLHAELLASRLSKTDDKKLTDSIIKEIRNLNGVVANFLEFTHFPRPSMKKIKISPIIDDVVKLLSPKMQRQHIEIKQTIEENDHYVPADREQMKQVFMNLIINAIEAMPEGGKMEITASVPSSTGEPKKGNIPYGGNYLEVSVSNNGPPIPEEVQEKIFNPFFTTKDQGTGVGLAIVHRIIDAHDGTITLESKEGPGTKFILRLPLSQNVDYTGC